MNWIKCSDKLPEIEQSVLVITGRRTAFKCLWKEVMLAHRKYVKSSKEHANCNCKKDHWEWNVVSLDQKRKSYTEDSRMHILYWASLELPEGVGMSDALHTEVLICFS